MPLTKEDVFKFYEIDRLNKLLDEQKKQTGIMERQERARITEADRLERRERAQRHDEEMTREWGQDWKTPAGQRRIFVAKMAEEWGPNWDSPETRILRQKKADEEAAEALAEEEEEERKEAEERDLLLQPRLSFSKWILIIFVSVFALVCLLEFPALFVGGRQTKPSSAPAGRLSTAPHPQPAIVRPPLAADTAGTAANDQVPPSGPAREDAARTLEGGEQQAGVKGEPARAALPNVVSATTQEPAAALPKELLKAATNGNVPAQYALGSTLEARNAFSEARDWLLKAASSGYAGAQFKLGEFAEKGLAGDRDLDEAVRWYRKAAAQGFEPAKLALARLDRSR